MTTIINKTPRLLEAAKEFNIGRETLVVFLTDKGFSINNNPSTKLSEPMYNALQLEFAQDKAAKRKSDEIALPKGSLFDNLKKSKESLDISRKDKKEETHIPTVQDTPKAKEPEKPKDVPRPATAEKPAEQPKEATPVAQKAPEPVIVKENISAPVLPQLKVVQQAPPPAPPPPPQPVQAPVAELPTQAVTIPKPAAQPVAEAPAAPVAAEPKAQPQQEDKVAEPAKPVAEEQAAPTKQAEPEEPQHLDIKAPKIEGPNILGKINLEEMNLSSRPKKGAVKKVTTGKVEVTKKEENIQPVSSTPAPPIQVAEPAKPAEMPVPAPVPTPVAEEVKTPQAPVSNPPAESDETGKPEHIEMRAPRLEGPKIIGRIELPVAQPSGGSRPNDREKRKRKRIPVEKKPEAFKPGTPGTGTPGTGPGQGGRGPGQGGAPGGNRPGGGMGDRNRPAGAPGSGLGNRGPGQGSGPGGSRPGGGTGDRSRPGGAPGGNRPGGGSTFKPGQGGGGRRPFSNEPVSQQQQEIDTKAIQDKIRETQAKLTGSTRSKNLKAKYRRNKRDEMAEKRAAAENSEQDNTIQVTEFISVSELASLLNVSFADIIGKCMSLGIMVSINQRLDAEVIELVASEFGYEVEFINLEQGTEEEEEEVDAPEDLVLRAPIVTIMGHVGHGKTSLLDYIRSANVVAGEAGGITQHIGAYQVTTPNGKKVTFLDTPGHEAFTAMRARGAKVADVAVIVVAADDAIMPQTKEAISHAQAANLPMIFAINKIDKPGADPEKIKQQLANMNILVESWGGKFQCEEISAKKGINIDVLLEKIGLEAELLELTANPVRSASGSVIEAKLDKGRGFQSTILVQNGTLKQGDMIVCGQYFGKVKAMFNERLQRVKVAGPSTPVQVLGLNGAPNAGEKFRVFEDENEAKELATHRTQIIREQGIRARKHITLDEIGRRLALGSFRELGIIIKGDFDGSVEALSDSLQKLATPEVAVSIVHKGVGQITESDVNLASASDAIILGFQVRPSVQAAKLAEQENIEIRTYSIIYDAIEEIKSAMEGLLEPKVEKKTVCNVEVREVYKIGGVGTIAGCYVLDGKIARNTRINLVRDGIVVFTGELSSLKRFKDDMKEVATGYECGIMVKNYSDIRVSDIIEGFEEVEVKRTL
ncbi:MAG: translation initiation factor IF-2 [Taibaiella sp.]|nr:translation initiation factor IF-2 [Taibaiella sp.]